ncbi:MAG: ABC transporter permease [Pseudomonadota bacterium]
MATPMNEQPMGERRFGRVNMLGLQTLILREVQRFWAVKTQTLLAPVVTAILFLMVFSLAFGERRGEDLSGAYIAFLAPGILMMSVIQNAFANTSSSLLSAKIQGNIVDTLMPPLSAGELTIGYTLGGVMRGMVVAVTVSAVVFPFIGLGVAHPIWALTFVCVSATLMSLLGLLAAIQAQKFDQMSMVTNFVVTPLSFLSGTFYSIEVLPGWLQAVSHANPFFYMIDGVRFAVLGQSDVSPVLGLTVIVAADVALGLLAWNWFRTGYRLKP